MAKRGRRNYGASRHGKGAGVKFFALLLALVFIGTAVACGFGWWQVVKLKEQIKQLTPADEEQNGDEGNNGGEQNGDNDFKQVGGITLTPDTDEVVLSSMKYEVLPMSYASDDYVGENEISTYSSYPYGYTIKATAYYEDGREVIDADQIFEFIFSPRGEDFPLNIDHISSREIIIHLDEVRAEYFTEQITLTIRYAFNSEIKRTVYIDYVAPVNDISYSIADKDYLYSDIVSNGSPSFHMSYFSDIKYIQGSAAYEKNQFYFLTNYKGLGGTIEDTFENATVTVKASSELQEAVFQVAEESGHSFTNEIHFKELNYGFALAAPSGNKFDKTYSIKTLLTSLIGGLNNDEYGYYVGAFYGLENQIEVNATLNFKYGGKVTFNYCITLILDNYKIVTDMDIDGDEHIIF